MSLHKLRESLQALDVSDQRMEEIVDSLISQITENNRARREIIEENVGNPEGRRSIRREFFALNSPSAQREAVSYFLDETELEVFDSFQEEREQQHVVPRRFIRRPGQPRGHRYSAELISACQEFSGRSNTSRSNSPSQVATAVDTARSPAILIEVRNISSGRSMMKINPTVTAICCAVMPMVSITAAIRNRDAAVPTETSVVVPAMIR